MRVFLLLLVILPVSAIAQINRSANELARESIQTYLTTRIFKDQSYTPGAYTELKPYVGRKTDVAWVIQHRFEIDQVEEESGKKNVFHKPYKFSFYLDKKMVVLKAEAAYVD